MFHPRHIPKFSFVLLKALAAPLLAFMAVVGNIVMLLAAYGFYTVEKEINPQVADFGDALWWAVCTVSTVGYGDIFPVTGMGRIIGSVLIIFGVMFFLTWTALLASVMSTFIAKEKL